MTDYDDLTDAQYELVMSTGLDYTCEQCGSELTIFDEECSECYEYTSWSTDCTVRDIIEAIANGKDSIDD